MNKTNIEWVKNPDGSQGYSWNPLTGCLNGCEYCYARKLANTRLRKLYLANKNLPPDYLEMKKSFDGWGGRKEPFQDPFYPRFWWDRLVEPTDNQKPRGIFTCNMSDLFGIGIPNLWTEEILLQIKRCPQHHFYLLTKQPQNLIKFSPFPDNCFVGVSATNQQQFDETVRYLKEVEATVKFISFEPLLERINVRSYAEGEFIMTNKLEEAGISWVILGSQTKPYKPPKLEWVEEIIRACDKAGVPVFLKDNLDNQLPEQDPLFRKNQYQLRQEVPR